MSQVAWVAWLALIVVHAVAGVVSFVAGILCLRLSAPGSGIFRLYLASLWVMVLTMGAAVAVHLGALDMPVRLTFLGLCGLGVYMLWRARAAGARLVRRDQGWRPKYVNDVGFTLIGLFDAFVIVAAIDLGAPSWLVAAIAIGGVVVGIVALRRVKAGQVSVGP